MEGFTQTQISTLAVRDNLLIAGGFQGELICKVLLLLWGLQLSFLFPIYLVFIIVYFERTIATNHAGYLVTMIYCAEYFISCFGCSNKITNFILYIC